jgi:hypothetical protein
MRAACDRQRVHTRGRSAAWARSQRTGLAGASAVPGVPAPPSRDPGGQPCGHRADGTASPESSRGVSFCVAASERGAGGESRRGGRRARGMEGVRRRERALGTPVRRRIHQPPVQAKARATRLRVGALACRGPPRQGWTRHSGAQVRGAPGATPPGQKRAARGPPRLHQPSWRLPAQAKHAARGVGRCTSLAYAHTHTQRPHRATGRAAALSDGSMRCRPGAGREPRAGRRGPRAAPKCGCAEGWARASAERAAKVCKGGRAKRGAVLWP